MKLAKTSYTNPVSGYEPGRFSRLYFRNWNESASSQNVTLGGYDSTHELSSVNFEQVNLDGSPITSPSQITTNSYVTNVNFYTSLQPDMDSTAGVVDNTDLDLTKTGSWSASTLTGFNGSSAIYCNGSGNTATWTPNLSAAGYYRVYVWYPYSANSTNAAQYTINYSGGSKAITVDQTGIAGEWQSLGMYPLPRVRAAISIPSAAA